MSRAITASRVELTERAPGASGIRGLLARRALVPTLLRDPSMLLPRAAVSSVADRSFTRRTIVVGATLALALGIGVGASSSDATDREVADVAVRTIQVPSLSGTDVGTVAHDLARAELAAYAFDAYPAWRARAGDRDCPERLLDVNRMRPALHAVDPWGTPYQFLCGRPYGLTGIVVRTAGPDRAFDTTDDLSTL